ncbi:MAG: hypothetical protein JWP47_2770 [Polaromonas sp.]|nr:hypothetical protein [Polaromonas sp.]
MNPMLQLSALCVCASFLLTGCPDAKTPVPPKVPQPKASMLEPASTTVAMTERQPSGNTMARGPMYAADRMSPQ